MSATAALKGVENTVTSFFYGGTTLFFGCGAIKKFPDVMKMLDCKKVGVVTGRDSYKRCGAWSVVESTFQKMNIEFVHYNKISTNPTCAAIDEATAMFASQNVGHVLAIGGGSPIDAAKSVSLLLKHPTETARSLYESKFNPTGAVPLVTINTTHGTGTEVDRFAVATITDFQPWPVKPAIANPLIYPKVSIDDPELCYTMGPDMTAWTTVDAMNHCMEASTTTIRNPFAVNLSREVHQIAAGHLRTALVNPRDAEARYYLLYGSAIAGAAFDACALHLTHAMEHPLSALKGHIAHGLGLAVLQPSVLKAIYPKVGRVIAHIMEPILPGLSGEPSEAIRAAVRYEQWLRDHGVPQKLKDLGFTSADLPVLRENLLKSPFLPGLLKLAPIEVTEDVLAGIYEESMVPLAEQFK